MELTEEPETYDFDDVIDLPIVTEQPLIDFSDFVMLNNTDLSLSQQMQLTDVLIKHGAFFSDTSGMCELDEHSIKITPGATIPERKLIINANELLMKVGNAKNESHFNNTFLFLSKCFNLRSADSIFRHAINTYLYLFQRVLNVILYYLQRVMNTIFNYFALLVRCKRVLQR